MIMRLFRFPVFLGVALLFVLGWSSLVQARVIVLTKDRRLTLPNTREYSLTYPFQRPARMRVVVNEVFGRNIRFKILQDGKIILDTGVQKGEAIGSVLVRPGQVAIVFMNSNLFVRKQILFSVYAQPVLTPPSLVAPVRVQYLTKSNRVRLLKRGQFAAVYNIFRPSLLWIKVVEAFGKKIEFRVINNGREVFFSGVHVGRAVGRVSVVPGKVSVVIINGNWVSGKVVDYSVGIVQ